MVKNTRYTVVNMPIDPTLADRLWLSNSRKMRFQFTQLKQSTRQLGRSENQSFHS